MSKYLNPKVDIKVEHLNPENVPDNQAKKYPIVDVRCTGIKNLSLGTVNHIILVINFEI